MPVVSNVPIVVGSAVAGMRLQDIHDRAASASYNSRSESEIWGAINEAGKYCYDWIKKEAPNSVFLVTDTTSVPWVAGTQDYLLPSALDHLIRMRIRLNAQEPWAIVAPSDWNRRDFLIDSYGTSIDFGGTSSLFEYAMFIPQSQIDTFGEQKEVHIEPAPLSAYLVELLYAARWTVISKANDPFNLPVDARYACEALALAELLRKNDDSNADNYEAKGQRYMTVYLDGLRKLQTQMVSTQQPYVDDLD
jgi:hypothetical protein